VICEFAQESAATPRGGGGIARAPLPAEAGSNGRCPMRARDLMGVPKRELSEGRVVYPLLAGD
jgi:hypothetical protein